MKKILLIGCGHMGKALLSSWLNSKQYHITVVDPIKFKFLKNIYKNKKVKVKSSISNLDKSINFNFIIFATRPNELNKAMDELLNININNKTSLISVVAGKKINIFQKKFKFLNNFFRVMPNMSATVNESMNCIVTNRSSSKIKKNEVLKLFSYSGKTMFLNNEDQIDMTTAITGSGPGFIFNLIDAMEEAAINLGFKKNIANTLVLQTFKGSIDLILNKKISAKELVKTVATKGGTTEAGLKIMKKNNIHRTFVDLTKAAYKKAKQQGK